MGVDLMKPLRTRERAAVDVARGALRMIAQLAVDVNAAQSATEALSRMAELLREKGNG
jgi:hypothetical protein